MAVERGLTRDTIERLARLGSWSWDRTTGETTWSPAMFRILGFAPGPVPPPGPDIAARIDPRDFAVALEVFTRVGETGGSFVIEQRVTLPDGTRRTTVVRGEATLDDAGRVVGMHGTTQDVTEDRESEMLLREREQQLATLALKDPLTGLANRAAFTDELRRDLESARRSGTAVALVMLDLDGFKTVNDSLGHAIGDGLLRQVAKRAVRAVRAGDFVARIGGDELIVLMREMHDPSEAARVAQRLVDQIRAPLVVEGFELIQTVSAGIAVAARGASPEAVMAEADAALYAAKAHGKDRLEFFDEELRARAAARLSLESALRQAVERGELTLDYQPEVDLTDGGVVAVEALLRWRRDDEVLEAQAFIAVAEETGLITSIGAWSIREACTHASRWEVRGPDGQLLTVRVNVSPLQMRDPALPDIVLGALRDSGLEASRLCLELTETAGLQAAAQVPANLARLRELGVRFAVDDFGVGDASLLALTRLPVDVLKLDREFTREVPSGRHADVVAGVVAFANRIGVPVTAEGIESDEQAAVLRSLGCRGGQGFLWSRALPAEDVDRLLSRPKPAWAS